MTDRRKARPLSLNTLPSVPRARVHLSSSAQSSPRARSPSPIRASAISRPTTTSFSSKSSSRPKGRARRTTSPGPKTSALTGSFRSQDHLFGRSLRRVASTEEAYLDEEELEDGEGEMETAVREEERRKQEERERILEATRKRYLGHRKGSHSMSTHTLSRTASLQPRLPSNYDSPNHHHHPSASSTTTSTSASSALSKLSAYSAATTSRVHRLDPSSSRLTDAAAEIEANLPFLLRRRDGQEEGEVEPEEEEEEEGREEGEVQDFRPSLDLFDHPCQRGENGGGRIRKSLTTHLDIPRRSGSRYTRKFHDEDDDPQISLSSRRRGPPKRITSDSARPSLRSSRPPSSPNGRSPPPPRDTRHTRVQSIQEGQRARILRSRPTSAGSIHQDQEYQDDIEVLEDRDAHKFTRRSRQVPRSPYASPPPRRVERLSRSSQPHYHHGLHEEDDEESDAMFAHDMASPSSPRPHRSRPILYDDQGYTYTLEEGEEVEGEEYLYDDVDPVYYYPEEEEEEEEAVMMMQRQHRRQELEENEDVIPEDEEGLEYEQDTWIPASSSSSPSSRLRGLPRRYPNGTGRRYVVDDVGPPSMDYPGDVEVEVEEEEEDGMSERFPSLPSRPTRLSPPSSRGAPPHPSPSSTSRSKHLTYSKSPLSPPLSAHKSSPSSSSSSSSSTSLLGPHPYLPSRANPHPSTPHSSTTPALSTSPSSSPSSSSIATTTNTSGTTATTTASSNSPSPNSPPEMSAPTHAQRLLERAANEAITRHQGLANREKVVHTITRSAIHLDAGLRALAEGRARGGQDALIAERRAEALWKESGEVVRSLTDLLLLFGVSGPPPTSTSRSLTAANGGTTSAGGGEESVRHPGAPPPSSLTTTSASPAHSMAPTEGKYISDLASDPGRPMAPSSSHNYLSHSAFSVTGLSSNGLSSTSASTTTSSPSLHHRYGSLARTTPSALPPPSSSSSASPSSSSSNLLNHRTFPSPSSSSTGVFERAAGLDKPAREPIGRQWR
ncbi:MAG: hypothetical protein DHS80DRAFT_28631 [Piptocephalis tieghemiana]|nr:MAG: hypothetical protein DHS80DRAFT_28631 [Piptocephalis tieghemiana]